MDTHTHTPHNVSLYKMWIVIKTNWKPLVYMSFKSLLHLKFRHNPMMLLLCVSLVQGTVGYEQV